MNWMLNALVWLRIWIDSRRHGGHLCEGTEGRFYVRYLDGARTRRFHYSTALTYAELEGGCIVHLATRRVVKETMGAMWLVQ